MFSCLPFPYRWRLLFLQPLSLLTYALKSAPYIFSAPFKVQYIPSRDPNRSIRAIIFRQPRLPGHKLRPLHLDIHGGGFIGGLGEYDAPFCKLLADRTGAVVVSTQYRCAPVHTFPAAHEDVEDVARWLRKNAEEKLGADPELLTMSGFSAGASLALGVSQTEGLCPPAKTAVKASVTFYAPVDFRIPPSQKPRPPNFPKYDPVLFVLNLLFDSYGGRINRTSNISNPILHPILAPVEKLPRDMYFVIAGKDILFHEQKSLVERLATDISTEGADRRLQVKVFKDAIHGWLELPSAVIDEESRKVAFNTAIEFLDAAYLRHGWISEDLT